MAAFQAVSAFPAWNDGELVTPNRAPTVRAQEHHLKAISGLHPCQRRGASVHDGQTSGSSAPSV